MTFHQNDYSSNIYNKTCYKWLCTLCLFKFANAAEEKMAKDCVPEVANYFLEDCPYSKHCEVLFGCYLETNDVVVTHINVARGLPEDQKTYLKIKIFPNPIKISKITTNIIDKRETALIGLYNKVGLTLTRCVNAVTTESSFNTFLLTALYFG